jgi:hypothetical protein
VGVAVFCMPFSVLRPCYAEDGSVLRGKDGDLPIGARER